MDGVAGARRVGVSVLIQFVFYSSEVSGAKGVIRYYLSLVSRLHLALLDSYSTGKNDIEQQSNELLVQSRFVCGDAGTKHCEGSQRRCHGTSLLLPDCFTRPMIRVVGGLEDHQTRARGDDRYRPGWSARLGQGLDVGSDQLFSVSKSKQTRKHGSR